MLAATWGRSLLACWVPHVPHLVVPTTHHRPRPRCCSPMLQREGDVPLWKKAAARLLHGSRSRGRLAGQPQEEAAEGGEEQQQQQAGGVGSQVASRNPITGLYEVAPCEDGRIACINGFARDE